MVAAKSLLRLYPRAWRERYGEEFLATVGRESLSLPQALDVFMGAIDAWLSADVRRATKPVGVAPGVGGPMTLKSMMVCERTSARFTKRDALIGAGVMLVGSLSFSLLGLAAARSGWRVTSGILLNFGFLASLMISMPFWLTKGQPWKAQAALIGFMLVMLAAIRVLSAII